MNFPHWELLVTWPNWIPLGFSTGAKADSELPALEALAAVFASQTEDAKLTWLMWRWRNGEMAKWGGFPNGWGKPGWFTSTSEHRTVFHFFPVSPCEWIKTSMVHWKHDSINPSEGCILATNLRSAEYRELVQEARWSGDATWISSWIEWGSGLEFILHPLYIYI